MKTTRVRMKVSIAAPTFSYQPNEVADVEEKLARQWIAVGHAERVSPQTPLSLRDFDYRDLDAEEALRWPCTHCQRRSARVLRGKPYCLAHFRAELES